MNIIEDFKNAPFEATATHGDGSRAVKIVDDCWLRSNGVYLEDNDMVFRAYTLDQPAPTTAREALDLAWELAYPVREGQDIPKGTRCLETDAPGLTEFVAQVDFKVLPGMVSKVRTLEKLPKPEPDWLDAPAVLAWRRWDDVRREKVWSKADECYKSTDGEIIDWTDLRDVTPLYPKEM